ncbi:hypothetical protein [Pseudomonas yamanorum]|uniref:hypothetical protein n=1 Tax=Pseudomonas yamanorum TaxID=515393 RepID=UPI003B9EC4CD
MANIDANINIVVNRTRPLTNRNEIFQVMGRMEGGLPGMSATILGVRIAGLASFIAYGASLPDSNFSIIVYLHDVGVYPLDIVPIYRSGHPLYPNASQPFNVVVKSNF